MSDPYQEVRSRLTGVVDDGDQKCKAICPCHDDHNPSLSVSVSDQGKVLLKCWGCDASAANIVHAIGMTMAQLFPKSDRPQQSKEPFKKGRFGLLKKAIEFYEKKFGPCTGKWEYKVGGQIVGYVVRFDPPGQDKEYRPIWRDGNGYVITAPKSDRPLYGVDGIVDGCTVYVCEGEKACDAARSIGLVAVSPMNGSKSPHKTDWSPVKGHDVVILRDNDEPGEGFANKVAELCLKAGAKSARILLLPGLPPKGDIVEWIGSFSDAVEPDAMKAEIETLVAAVEPIKPEQPKREFEIIDVADLVTQFPEEERPVIFGLLRQGEIMNVIASSKTGKSWLVASLAICVSFGWNWLGRFVTRQGRVLMIDNELRKKTLAFRMRQLLEGMGVPPENARGKIETISTRGNLIDLRKFIVFLNSIEAGTYSLVVLDAFYRFLPAGVDENSNSQITQLYNELDIAVQRLGAAVAIVHHTSKGNQSLKSITDTGAGAGAQSRCADTHLIVRSHEEEGAAVIEAVTRSFKQPESFCARWVYPKWEPADDLDPTNLRQERPRRQQAAPSGPTKDEIRQTKEQTAKLKVLKIIASKPQGETVNALRSDCGMSGQTFGPIKVELLEEGLIIPCKVKKGSAEHDGLMITEDGITALGQLGQLGQNTPLSVSSGGSRTSAPPLGGMSCPSPSPSPSPSGLF